MSTGTMKIKMYRADWADKIAGQIADQSSMTPDEYREHLKKELAGEEDYWGGWASVNTWCGTAVIAKELRKAYERGRSAGRRAAQHRVEPTAPVAKRNSPKSSNAVSSKRRGGSR